MLVILTWAVTQTWGKLSVCRFGSLLWQFSCLDYSPRSSSAHWTPWCRWESHACSWLFLVQLWFNHPPYHHSWRAQTWQNQINRQNHGASAHTELRSQGNANMHPYNYIALTATALVSRLCWPAGQMTSGQVVLPKTKRPSHCRYQSLHWSISTQHSWKSLLQPPLYQLIGRPNVMEGMQWSHVLHSNALVRQGGSQQLTGSKKLILMNIYWKACSL